MAVKTKSRKVKDVPEEIKEVKPSAAKAMEGKWVGFGWILLLIGGLAHMLPEQMAPLLKWSLFGVSLQLAVGVVSVILALNFLLEE
jgi:hypothetical protein